MTPRNVVLAALLSLLFGGSALGYQGYQAYQDLEARVAQLEEDVNDEPGSCDTEEDCAAAQED